MCLCFVTINQPNRPSRKAQKDTLRVLRSQHRRRLSKAEVIWIPNILDGNALEKPLKDHDISRIASENLLKPLWKPWLGRLWTPWNVSETSCATERPPEMHLEFHKAQDTLLKHSESFMNPLWSPETPMIVPRNSLRPSETPRTTERPSETPQSL